MALVISFKIVVTDSRESREGRSIEEVGYYDPAHRKGLLKIDLDRVDAWVKKGALPTEAVKALIKRYKKQQKATGEGN